MDYSQVNYLSTLNFQKFKAARSSESLDYPIFNLHATSKTMESQEKSQATLALSQERPVTYERCTLPYYPLCMESMFESHPSAFRPAGKIKKTPSFDQQLPFLYENRRICTCRCYIPAQRATPPCLETFYKSKSAAMDQEPGVAMKPTPEACFPGFYRWFLPSRRYVHEDVPLGVRLSTMTSEREASEKRPAPKRFQCTHCEKSFGKSSHLRDHIRTHTGDRPYRCEYCEKAFTQYSNLRTHTRIHTGERPYRCRHCNKSFTQAVTLRSHARTHTGMKAFRCKQCTKSFACFSGLKEHTAVHQQENTQSTMAKSITIIKQEKISDV